MHFETKNNISIRKTFLSVLLSLYHTPFSVVEALKNVVIVPRLTLNLVKTWPQALQIFG
jgi:hypothetical protein